MAKRNGHAEPDQDDPLEAFKSWEARRDQLRATLIAEREELLTRVKSINDALKSVAAPMPLSPRGPGRPLAGPGTKTEAVVTYLRNHPGSHAEDVYAATGVSRAMMNYMKERNLVKYEGSRRHARWFAVSGQPEGQGDE